MFGKRTSYAALAAVPLLLPSGRALAAEFSWINPAGGSFHDAGNWSPNGGPPSGQSKAVLDLPGSYTITFSAQAASGTLDMQNGNVTLTTLAEAGVSYSPGEMRIGTVANQSATLNVLGGSGTLLYSGIGGVRIGEASLAAGTLNLNGGRVIYSAGGVTVGKLGDGTLLMNNAKFTAPSSYFVVGAGSLSHGYVGLANQSNMFAGWPAVYGDYGTAELNLSGASSMNNEGATVGRSSSGSGFVHVHGPGTQWYVHSTLILGDQGSGSMLVNDGGRLSYSTTWYLGKSVGGAGTAVISGTGTRADPAMFAYVGYAGRGAIAVTDGATFGSSIVIGVLPGSTGSLRVAGAGTLVYGPISIGSGVGGPPGGTGTVTLDGGAITASSLLVKSDCFVHYNGGALRTGTLDVRGGQVLLAPDADVLLEASRIKVVSTGSVGIIDLNDNDLKASDTTYSSMVTLLRSPRYDPSTGWYQGGIGSTVAQLNLRHNTTLGVVTGDQYLAANGSGVPFHGATVSATDVLVKYTYYGDTDLNGGVNFDDYTRIDAGYISGGTDWFAGDFDLNGIVDFDDYVLIDLGFNSQNGTLIAALNWLEGEDRSPHAGSYGPGSGFTEPGVAMVARHFEQFGLDYVNAFYASVPEPAMGAIALSLMGASSLRRRRLG